jgi:hypothetical protein
MSELETCGCGKPVRYETRTGNACNKYSRCAEPNADTLICLACDLPKRNRHQFIDEMAFALFRRHLIDADESKRLAGPLTESGIQLSWSADGRQRAYWYLLAREAFRMVNAESPTPLKNAER